MILYFRSLAMFNKAANHLISTVETTTDSKLTLHGAQNILAKMYGWDHYVQMHEAHATQKCHASKYVDNLTTMEKDVFAQQKKMVLLSELFVLQFTQLDIGKVTLEYFNKRSLLANMFDKNKGIALSSYHQIPDHRWELGTLLVGNTRYNVVNWIRKLTLQQAVENGGIFVLRNATASDIIEDFESLLGDEAKERLRVVHLESSPSTTNAYDRRLDPLYHSCSHEQFRSLLHTYCEESLRGYHFGKFQHREIEFISALRPLLRGLEEYQRSYCFKELYANGILTLDWVSKQLFERQDEGLHSMAAFLGDITGFDESILKQGKKQPQIAYDSFNQALEGLYEFIRLFNGDVDKGNLLPLDIKESLLGNAITIHIIDDDPDYEKRMTKIALANIRTGAAPMLGNRLEFGPGSDEHNTRRLGDCYKPVVFEDYMNYVMRGMSVVMAQLSTSGFSPFYHVSQIETLEGDGHSEWQSLRRCAQNHFFYFGCTHFDILSTQEEKLCFGIDEVIRETQKDRFVFSAPWLDQDNKFHVMLD